MIVKILHLHSVMMESILNVLVVSHSRILLQLRRKLRMSVTKFVKLVKYVPLIMEVLLNHAHQEDIVLREQKIKINKSPDQDVFSMLQQIKPLLILSM